MGETGKSYTSSCGATGVQDKVTHCEYQTEVPEEGQPTEGEPAKSTHAEDPEKRDEERKAEAAEVEEHFKAGVMHFEFNKARSTWRGTKYEVEEEGAAVSEGKGEIVTGARFPDQKITVREILNGERNHLASHPERLRYFHFPANHMRWVEDAVARYYGEHEGQGEKKEKEEGKNKEKKKEKETSHLLSREHWRGQLHGGGVPRAHVHARHMRSRCSHIPLGTGSAMLTQKDEGHTPSTGDPHQKPPNFAIFLPYLHWETNRRRAKMAQIVKEVTAPHHPQPSLTMKRNPGASTSGTLETVVRQRTTKIPTIKKLDRKNFTSVLGRYLYDLAQLWDAMDYEADERLIRSSLWGEDDAPEAKPVKWGGADAAGSGEWNVPPLHIRRTLDQSYFLTLEDTSYRDKDQVIYRQTRSRTKQRHCPQDKQPKKSLPNEPSPQKTDKPQQSRKANAQEPNLLHARLTGLLNAKGTKPADSKKKTPAKSRKTELVGVTRVVMVDQLWMWILDEKTIITSFPRRWGNNKPDSSGIHKSLRTTLERNPEVRSVYHLALMIIDHCSKVFFDKTQPTDDRPEVMDLFGEAIGNVTDSTTSAFEIFWDKVKYWPRCGKSAMTDSGYLNINPEGVLLREAQDIAEELSIMSGIYAQQLGVLGDLQKYMKKRNSSPSCKKKGLPAIHRADIQEANDLVGEVANRQKEIDQMHQAVEKTTAQLLGLLALKQQQASIIEAKVALERANEGVRQGRTIMAFTVVTIFFMPLGFFAAIFGMNNASTGQPWMTFSEQLDIMFKFSLLIIIVSLSVAFIRWIRLLAAAVVQIPAMFVWEILNVRGAWHFLHFDYQTLNAAKENALRMMKMYADNRRKERRKEGKDKKSQEGKAANAAGTEEEGSSTVANGGANGTTTGWKEFNMLWPSLSRQRTKATTAESEA